MTTSEQQRARAIEEKLSWFPIEGWDVRFISAKDIGLRQQLIAQLAVLTDPASIVWAHGSARPFNGGLSVRLFVLTTDSAIQVQKDFQAAGHYSGHTSIEPRASLRLLTVYSVPDLAIGDGEEPGRMQLGLKYGALAAEISPPGDHLTRPQSDALATLLPAILVDLKANSPN